MRPGFALYVLAALFVPSAARAEDPPAWEIGSPPSPPPPAPPPAAAPPPPTIFEVEQKELSSETPTKMWSPVVFGLGLTFSGVGFVGLISGFFMNAEIPSDCTGDCLSAGKRDLATGLMLGSGALLLLGIPMAYVGGRQVPDRPSWAKAVPDVWISPRGGGLRFTF